MLKRLFSARVFWSGTVAAFVTLIIPRYITYDTEIRCLADPCPEASANTSLFGWLWETQPKVIDADYYIPVIGFLVYFAIAFWLYPKVRKYLDK